MILSILICTIPKRKDLLERLVAELRSQILQSKKEVEILIDGREGTIGAKSQRLIEKAQSEYVAFIDDDDMVSSDYLSSILYALETKPDVVGFMGWITTNGRNKTNFKISKECGYNKTGRGYERFNNHLSPVKREIALQIGYKDVSWQEDYDYALRLTNSGLIKTERFISKALYYYQYVTTKSYS
jgi:hypothetical protein